MRSALKRVAEAAALVVVLPGLLAYSLAARVAGRERAFPGWSEALSLLPGLSGAYLRRAFYRRVLQRCGADCHLGFGTTLSHPAAEIGRAVYVGPFGSLGAVTLEDDVLLAAHVSIINGGAQHGIDRLDVPIRDQPGVLPRVTIGTGSWIGERAVVLADVGRHCVVGAGAVVTRPIPDHAVAVGVPARVVRFRDGRPAPSGPDAPPHEGCPDRRAGTGPVEWSEPGRSDARDGHPPRTTAGGHARGSQERNAS